MSFAPNKNRIPTVHFLEAQERLGELVELSQTQGQPFRIVNENKPVAWLISPQHMYELNLMISLILQKDAGLADTLAILANDEIQQQLEESTTDIEAGKGTPLESLLE